MVIATSQVIGVDVLKDGYSTDVKTSLKSSVKGVVELVQILCLIEYGT